MTTTFETAKVGDRVWSITEGWGKITDISDYYDYPLDVMWDSGGSDTFTLSGYSSKILAMQSLFWDEITIIVPSKPLPKLEVDTKVLVWNHWKEHAQKAHFCCFQDGKIYTYEDGRTSFTRLLGEDLKGWDNWELVE